VLEVFVRRANLQTTGTIYNKETQKLAYTDDIDIVSRSLSVIRDAYLAFEREAVKVMLKIRTKDKIYDCGPWGKAWQLAINTLKNMYT
jgi:hypothetical protein